MSKCVCHHIPNDGVFKLGKEYEYQYGIDCICVHDDNGKRIIFDEIADNDSRDRIVVWKEEVFKQLELTKNIREAITGVVFEVRQGYKSKDSKRQNADIANAANAYANGYVPCLMVMSSQIDDDILIRYRQAKWLILQGFVGLNEYTSTYDFYKTVVGFDFVDFMNNNQEFFQAEIHSILEKLMRAE